MATIGREDFAGRAIYTIAFAQRNGCSGGRMIGAGSERLTGSIPYWRLPLQYVGYTEFDGLRHGASDNNSVYLSLWLALASLGWKVQR